VKHLFSELSFYQFDGIVLVIKQHKPLDVLTVLEYYIVPPILRRISTDPFRNYRSQYARSIDIIAIFRLNGR